MAQDETRQTVPNSVGSRLRQYSLLLARGHVRAVRLAPLLVRAPIPDLIRRRRALYSHCSATACGYGYRVEFSRALRATPEYPEGRSVDGEFDLLTLSDEVCVVASGLASEEHEHGPQLLADRVYPLATRPFAHSAGLVALIRALAASHEWTSQATDSMGYDRKTLDFRRDCKKQPVEDALREMREQERHLHKVKVRFCDQHRRSALVASFSRHAEAVVYRGSMMVVLEGFLIPAVNRLMTSAPEYDLERARRPAKQEVLELVFPDTVFSAREDLDDLCRAARTADGLSVTTLHLNPYLQAQVLDFLSGAAIEMVVLDEQTVSLIPRSGDCQPALERIAERIFYYFGEAELRRRPIRA